MKFRKRTLKRIVKGKEHLYPQYSWDFSIKLNQKIKPHEDKEFDSADITSKETPTEEILNFSFIRNKLPKKLKDSKHS